MATVFNILAILVMVAVVIVLIRGLVNMMRGGSGHHLEQADAGARAAAVRRARPDPAGAVFHRGGG